MWQSNSLNKFLWCILSFFCILDSLSTFQKLLCHSASGSYFTSSLCFLTVWNHNSKEARDPRHLDCGDPLSPSPSSASPNCRRDSQCLDLEILFPPPVQALEPWPSVGSLWREPNFLPGASLADRREHKGSWAAIADGEGRWQGNCHLRRPPAMTI